MTRLAKVPVLVCSFVLATNTILLAQATRTWVSGVGDDANPCSRTAPCKTFAGAISKTAPDGEIDALDPGGFGAVTITKSLTIDGGGGQVASVLVSGTNGIVVAAGSNDVVVLRNIRIDGLGTGLNGIRFISGKALQVENCEIFSFTGNGIDIEPSNGAQVFVSGSAVEGTAKGVFASGTGSKISVTVEKSRFFNNQWGVWAGDFSQVTVRDSNSSGNSSHGFVSLANSGGTASLNLQNSTASNNGVGVQAGGGGSPSVVRMTGVSLFDNGLVSYTGSGGSFVSYGNNYLTGATGPQ